MKGCTAGIMQTVQTSKYKRILFLMLLSACCLPVVTAPVALTAGVAVGLGPGNPWFRHCSVWSKRLLQCSVIGLGFGVNLSVVLQTGRDAFFYTAISIAATMLAGYLLGRLFQTSRNTSLLISFGTAICGGSAIAAMAPVIQAESEETGVALATIFTLNAAGLLLFPALGHLLSLDQQQFGLWAALAIHDTSSVVGAATAYGATALAIGTTVKLARALWIMPSALIAAWLVRSESKVAVPWFIFGFIAAAALRSLLPHHEQLWHLLHQIARQSLVVTLFLIGSGLTRELLGRTGIRPLLQAVILWVIVSAASLGAIYSGWIR